MSNKAMHLKIIAQYFLLAELYFLFLTLDISMSRAQKNIQKTTKYSQPQLAQIKSVSQLLDSFLKQKIHETINYAFQKIKSGYIKKKKYGNMLAMVIAAIASRKKKEYVWLGFRKLQDNMLSTRNQQIQQFSALNQKVKEKSTKLIGGIFNRLSQTKQKQYFKHLNSQARASHTANNFKYKHLARVFNQIKAKNQKIGLEKLSNWVLRTKNIEAKFKFIDRLLSQKVKYNQSSTLAFFKSLNKPNNETAIQSPVPPKKQPVKRIVESPKETAQATKIQKEQQQVDEKSRKLQKQMDNLKREKDRIINDYNKEIKKYEREQESLKFNNDLLDQSIKELENQLMQRQKKNVKKLTNTELWQQVYSNLLYTYQSNNGTLTREQLLQALQCPLVPINVDIDALKTQNQILTDLIGEYKKFYENSHDNLEKNQDYLPYDILVAKNKFLFSAVDTLIEQGIGTQSQVKQLQEDIETLSRSS